MTSSARPEDLDSLDSLVGLVVTDWREAALILAEGGTVSCLVGRARDGTPQTMRVLAIRDGKALVSHWTDFWVRFDDPAYCWLAYRWPSFNDWLSRRGIEYPDLGVNCPVGSDWTQAENLGRLGRMYRNGRADDIS